MLIPVKRYFLKYFFAKATAIAISYNISGQIELIYPPPTICKISISLNIECNESKIKESCNS